MFIQYKIHAFFKGISVMRTVSAAAVRDAAGVAAAFPHVWRANQLGSYRTATVPTGHATLDRELPDGGWPASVLIELLTQQPGIGEMRLLQPALRQAGSRAIALVQPPYPPQAAAWAAEGFPVQRLVWVKSRRTVDALWAAEQSLRNRSCVALVLWQPQVRHEALRRLHLAAQGGDATVWLVRPLAAAQEASPAPLRLALRPAAAGIRIDIVKRRGPRRDAPLIVPLENMPAADFHSFEPHHASVAQRPSAVVTARNAAAVLV
ncbi:MULTISPECIES: translesion DNA synthesis-associated protein ImuA [Noviherbaspirillum]|jgi:protein ImuA|nr:translesion DNA synthesis-associated protein ImuA [Noviherbaspirillum galbum]